MYKVPRTHTRMINSGLSLVESLVAIAILLVVTTAVMSTAQGSLQATYASSDQITAFYLAQEANEYVRNVRDSNTLSEINDWDEYLRDCVGVDTKCIVDASERPEDGGLSVCSGGQCDPLIYDSVQNRYGYGAGVETNFNRYISLTQPGDNPEELQVTTTVEWKAGIRSREVVVESLIFNWN